MSSIISGFNYDIFISYRQKDNRYDGWVTEFADNLKKELEAIFKEDINVYVDTNPHDGLLETHDVDASLKEKLKCLVFIPIISHTYCDPKSFAWEHEFKVFIKLASQDQFGLKIKLPNGNVESRVLPVRIYDLDTNDIKQCESILGGALRSVDFIYKSSGVNRPLRASEDHSQDNINKTYYRDQINKVANSVKEIITAIEQYEQRPEDLSGKIFTPAPASAKHRNNKTKVIAGPLIVLILILLGYFFIPKLFNTSEPLEKSIAVLPFRNDSPDSTNRYFIDGTMEAILNNLCKIADLTVISRTSVEQFRNTTIPVREIAKKLNVNYILEGSGQKYGNKILLTVQLIDAVNDKHIWSSPYEGEVDDIFKLQNQIAETIASKLRVIVTPQEETLLNEVPTRNTLAYDYYLKGKQLEKEGKRYQSIEMYDKAIEQDSLFTLAYLEKANSYSVTFYIKGRDWQGKDDLAKANLEKAMKINPNLPEVRLSQAIQLYRFDHNYDKALELLDELKNQMSVETMGLWNAILTKKGRWEESLNNQLRSSQLDPLNGFAYLQIANTYLCMRKYPEALEFYKKSHIIFANRTAPPYIFLTILLWKGDLQEAWNAYSSAITDLGEIPSHPYSYYYHSRQYEKLIPLTEKSESHVYYMPRTLNLARIHFLDSHFSLSRQYADSAIVEINPKVKESPEDDRYYAALGYAYAFKGENQRAIDNAEKAVTLMPIKADALEGFIREMDLVKVYIFCGEYDLAMDKIEYLLTIPGELSVPLLKIDPVYDQMRNLPRFQKILTSEYQTMYK